MAALSEFERFVAPSVPGAPLPAVHDALLDASIEFCTRTRVLRETLLPISLTPGIPEIEIDPPEADTQIVEVLAAWLPEGKLQAASRADLDTAWPQGWQDVQVSSTAQVRAYWCRAPGLIRLVPMLNQKAVKALTLEVALAPTRDAADMPDVLRDRYVEVLAVGALARLHQHAASWADPARALSYLQLFDNQCTRLADEAALGFQRAPLRIIADHW